MSRRPPQESQTFGSDSFLDIIANMVGILIILIVIVGARIGASRPLSVAELEAKAATVEAARNAHQNRPIDPIFAEEPVVVAAEPEPVVEQQEEVAPFTAPAEWIAELASLANESRQLQHQAATVRAQYESADAEAAAIQNETRSLGARVTQASSWIDDRQSAFKASEQGIERKRETLRALLAEFEKAQATQTPTKSVKHRLAPVGQTVTGEEIHFRVYGGRVAYVPIRELETRVFEEIRRRRDIIINVGRLGGVVGPIEGFTCKYQIAVQKSAILAGRNSGIRAQMECFPEPDLITESVDEALQGKSRFAQRLRESSGTPTVTFWVYADSFAEFRRLQEACHAESMLVSARPLPDGKFIGMGTEGTKSVGQ
jgi:hypothetical protein